MILVNETKQRQQINFISKPTMNVLPGMSIEIDEHNMYNWELARICRVFRVKKKISKKREDRKEEKKNKEKETVVKTESFSPSFEKEDETNNGGL